jgi:hypothetical protein
MILGVPVLNGHEQTRQFIEYLTPTIVAPQDFHLIVIDNASDPPYSKDELPVVPFELSILRNKQNLGFYTPIQQLYDIESLQDHDIIAVAHNDVTFWEIGWDERLRDFFDDDDLGLVGLCGSDEIDLAGGRGGGTMCHFRGERGQLQEHTGLRITGLEPALILDSLFMAFIRDVIPHMKINDKMPLAHFMDKLLPVRAIRAGYKVAVAGIEIDHMGGQTIVAEPRFEEDAKRWCDEQGLPLANGDGGLTMYLEAELRFKAECADLLPSKINKDWEVSVVHR